LWWPQRKAPCIVPSVDKKPSVFIARDFRSLQDLPWGSFRLQLRVCVHRFFCQNPDCLRKIFTERLPELMEPSARRTTRLRDALRAIGWALGGRAGARQCRTHAMPVCATTLLSVLRREGSAAVATLSSFSAWMIGRFAHARPAPCWLIWSGISRWMCFWAAMRRCLLIGSVSTQELRLLAVIVGPVTGSGSKQRSPASQTGA
jgi:hypothetical protein